MRFTIIPSLFVILNPALFRIKNSEAKRAIETAFLCVREAFTSPLSMPKGRRRQKNSDPVGSWLNVILHHLC